MNNYDDDTTTRLCSHRDVLAELGDIHHTIYREMLPKFLQTTPNANPSWEKAFARINSINALAPAFIRFLNGLVHLELIPAVPPPTAQQNGRGSVANQAMIDGIPFEKIDLCDVMPTLLHRLYHNGELTFSFHGTKDVNAARSILINGLDPALRSANVLGGGEYSSLDPQTALVYGNFVVLCIVVQNFRLRHPHFPDQDVMITHNPVHNAHSFILPIAVGFWNEKQQTMVNPGPYYPHLVQQLGPAQTYKTALFIPNDYEWEQLCNLNEQLHGPGGGDSDDDDEDGGALPTWSVEDDRGGWNVFDPHVTRMVERWYKQYRNGGRPIMTYHAHNVDGHRFQYKVHFGHMQQENLGTGRMRNIVRYEQHQMKNILCNNPNAKHHHNHNWESCGPALSPWIDQALDAYAANPNHTTRFVHAQMGSRKMFFDAEALLLFFQHHHYTDQTAEVYKIKHVGLHRKCDQRILKHHTAPVLTFLNPRDRTQYNSPHNAVYEIDCRPVSHQLSTLLHTKFVEFINTPYPTLRMRYVLFTDDYSTIRMLDMSNFVLTNIWNTGRQQQVRLKPGIQVTQLNSILHIVVQGETTVSINHEEVRRNFIKWYFSKHRFNSAFKFTLTVADGGTWPYQLTQRPGDQHNHFVQKNLTTGKERHVSLRFTFA